MPIGRRQRSPSDSSPARVADSRSKILQDVGYKSCILLVKVVAEYRLEPYCATMDYRPRIVDRMIAQRLQASPTVVVEGVRGSGKTEAARRQARSEVLFDVDSHARALAEIDPAAVIEGPEPRLLDEWQHSPAVWNHVRRASDEGRRPGRFILTGSAVPSDDATRHSGAGRVSRIRLRPMTLFETGDSTGAVGLEGLLSSGGAEGRARDAGLSGLTEALCRGGWPASLGSGTPAAQQYVRDYLDEIHRADVGRTSGRGRDPAGMRRLLRSLARNTATEASQATLAADAGGEQPLHRDTVRAYIDALERVFVVEDQPAWSARLRSRSRLRRASKRHLADPSLAAAALRAGPRRLRRDLELVITAVGGYAYTRPDGVAVVPITALGP